MPATASARVAGSLKWSGRLRWVIQTAPSTVARQIAPWRVAMTLAGPPAQALLAVHAEQVERLAGDRVEHAGMALGGADPADDRGRGVGGPVDRALGLADQRPRPPAHRRVGVVEPARREARLVEAGHRVQQRADRAAPDLVAVEAALAGVARAERARAPHVAAVDLAGGLQDGHAPLPRAELDRPVQRRRPAVADRAGVHDQAAVPRPDRLGDDRLQDRADDQLGRVPGDGGLHRRAVLHHRDLDRVAELGERDLRPLAEAVVGGDEEEDPQRPGGAAHRHLAAEGARARPQDVLESGRAGHAPGIGASREAFDRPIVQRPRRFGRTSTPPGKEAAYSGRSEGECRLDGDMRRQVDTRPATAARRTPTSPPSAVDVRRLLRRC